MNELKNLLKETFDLFVKKRWLKAIDKEVNKYNRIKRKRTKVCNELRKQEYILDAMIKRYNEIYGEDLRQCKKEGADNG